MTTYVGTPKKASLKMPKKAGHKWNKKVVVKNIPLNTLAALDHETALSVYVAINDDFRNSHNKQILDCDDYELADISGLNKSDTKKLRKLLQTLQASWDSIFTQPNLVTADWKVCDPNRFVGFLDGYDGF